MVVIWRTLMLWQLVVGFTHEPEPKPGLTEDRWLCTALFEKPDPGRGLIFGLNLTFRQEFNLDDQPRSIGKAQS